MYGLRNIDIATQTDDTDILWSIIEHDKAKWYNVTIIQKGKVSKFALLEFWEVTLLWGY